MKVTTSVPSLLPHRRYPLSQVLRRPIISVLVVALPASSLLAAGCGGGSSPAAATTQNGAVAFSHCMRSNGVLRFPDPGSGGVVPKVALQNLGVSSSRFQAAQSACQHLLPTRSPAQRQEVAAMGLQFSRCVRDHGVPNFPDPDNTGRIPDPATVGINQGSPKFEAANQTCRAYRPPYMPSNADYNAYARAHG